MKTDHGIVLLLSLLVMCVIPTWGLEAPAQSEDLSAPVVYKDLMLVISTKDGVAAVVFGDDIENGVIYRYRFLPKGVDKVQAGDGKVFEKYDRVPATLPDSRVVTGVVDRGSELFIMAGPIRLKWSYSGKGQGWVYYEPEQTRVQIAFAKEFEKCNLKRFTF